MRPASRHLVLLLLCACPANAPKSGANAPDRAAKAPERGANAPERAAMPAPKPASERVPASQPSAHGAHVEIVVLRATDGSTNTTGMRQNPCPSPEPCPCYGLLAVGRPAVEKLGVTEPQLARGTPCLLADLDHNGYADLVFVDGKYGAVDGLPRQAASATALFFGPAGLQGIAPLPKKVSVLSVESGPDGSRLVAGSPPSRYLLVLNNGQLVAKPLPR